MQAYVFPFTPKFLDLIPFLKSPVFHLPTPSTHTFIPVPSPSLSSRYNYFQPHTIPSPTPSPSLCVELYYLSHCIIDIYCLVLYFGLFPNLGDKTVYSIRYIYSIYNYTLMPKVRQIQFMVQGLPRLILCLISKMKKKSPSVRVGLYSGRISYKKILLPTTSKKTVIIFCRFALRKKLEASQATESSLADS